MDLFGEVTGSEFSLGFVEGGSATGTVVSARSGLMLVVLSRSSILGALLPENAELLGGQLHLPLCL